MGGDLVSLGMVVGLDYRDVSLSVHDLLQELKTHSRVRKILDGGERIAWGAKTIPEGGYYSLPSKLHAPGLVLCGDGAGFVNVPALKGIHYAIESGVLAAEAIAQALRPGEAIGRAGALAGYDEAMGRSFVTKDLKSVRNMRQAFAKGFWMGGARAGMMTASGGRAPRKALPTEPDSEHELIRTERGAAFPAPDGKLTFDKLSSVFLSGNRTRDDAPSHIRVAKRVPREVGELWVNMCPAQVYELGREDAGKVEVVVTPSNCVQCGAITAKGGRLLPAEGGAGPEYSLT
jgi:electron-transferring-flavoprotein dehydrogenase